MRASFAAILLAACAIGAAHGEPLKESNYIRAEKPLCKFRYDEKLETRALTALQRELSSSGARFYDASDPIITVCRKKAIMMFSATLEPQVILLDPPNIFIVVDICTHRIMAVDRDDGTTVSNDPPCV